MVLHVGNEELMVKMDLTFHFKYFESIFLLKGMKMALCVSGMPQGSVFTPCTSSAQRESSSQTPTQMTTWTRAVRESGLHSARSVWLTLVQVLILNFLITQLFTGFIRHLILWIIIYIFLNIRWAALTHIATTLGLAFRRSTCVNTADISQWLGLQDKWVLMWEFKGRHASLKTAILKWYLLFSCYINYYIYATRLHLSD